MCLLLVFIMSLINKCILTICSLIIAINLVSCSSSDTKDEEKSQINVSRETLQTTITMPKPKQEEILDSDIIEDDTNIDEEEEHQITEEEKSYEYSTTKTKERDYVIKKIENNVPDDIDLSKININDKEISIDGKLESFLNRTEFKRNLDSSIVCDEDSLHFEGNSFGLSDEGTQIGIECYFYFDVVRPNFYSDDSMPKYELKGICSTVSNTKDDFEVIYCNGVKLGLSKEDTVSLLGKPKTFKISDSEQRLYYKNKNNTMIIVVRDDVVSEIYLFKNEVFY